MRIYGDTGSGTARISRARYTMSGEDDTSAYHRQREEATNPVDTYVCGQDGGFKPLSGTGDTISHQEPHAVPLPGTAAPSDFELCNKYECKIVTSSVRPRDLPCNTRMKIAVSYQR